MRWYQHSSHGHEARVLRVVEAAERRDHGDDPRQQHRLRADDAAATRHADVARAGDTSAASASSDGDDDHRVGDQRQDQEEVGGDVDVGHRQRTRERAREHRLVGLAELHADRHPPLARDTGCRTAARSSGPAPSFCSGTVNGGRSSPGRVSCTVMSVTVAGPPPVGSAVKCMSLRPGDSGGDVDVDPHLLDFIVSDIGPRLHRPAAGAAFTSSAVIARIDRAITTSTHTRAAEPARPPPRRGRRRRRPRPS